MAATNEFLAPPRESYQGIMTKRIIDMTPEERQAYYEQGSRLVREQLFAIGQPLVYRKDGQIIVEHADGRINHRD
jgi:hypothetical protein